MLMTKDDLIFLIETGKNLEFDYNGKKYILTYDKTKDGNTDIVFGAMYEQKRYKSLGEFWNDARVENHFFKDMLDIL